MSIHHTKTVESAYMGRDGKPRCFVKGNALPLFTDELLNEGDAVIVQGNRAVRPNTIQGAA